jgi:hypothetical protein
MAARAKVIAFGFAAAWFYALMAVALLAGADGPVWFPAHLARYWMFYAGIIVFVSWIAFVVDAFRNPRVPQGKRKLWGVVLLFAGPWAMPVLFLVLRPPRKPGVHPWPRLTSACSGLACARR